MVPKVPMSTVSFAHRVIAPLSELRLKQLLLAFWRRFRK